MPRVRFKKAVTRWSLDSGGFTELQQYGTWNLSSEDYSSLVNTYAEKVGKLLWAAPQDWMCEPAVIAGLVTEKKEKTRSTVNFDAWLHWAEELPDSRFKVIEQTYYKVLDLGKKYSNIQFHGTALSIGEHQRRTVENFILLQGTCSVPIIPVIQGFSLEDYHRCIDLYAEKGVDLSSYRTVGVGSICRRQASKEAIEILKTIYDRGISIHGFGLKKLALKNAVQYLVSADSMAWSFNARHSGKSCGKFSKITGAPIKNCANCHHAAVEWYDETMKLIPGVK